MTGQVIQTVDDNPPYKADLVKALREGYKDCPTVYLPLRETNPLILWLRGQLK